MAVQRVLGDSLPTSPSQASSRRARRWNPERIRASSSEVTGNSLVPLGNTKKRSCFKMRNYCSVPCWVPGQYFQDKPELWRLKVEKGILPACRDVYTSTVDSKKLEYGCRVICDGVPSFFCFAIRGQSCSNFLASTV